MPEKIVRNLNRMKLIFSAVPDLSATQIGTAMTSRFEITETADAVVKVYFIKKQFSRNI